MVRGENSPAKPLTQITKSRYTKAIMEKLTQTNVKTSQPNPRAERAHRRLLKAAAKDGDTLLIQYDNSLAGYDEDDVAERRDEYGINKITSRAKDSLVKKIVGAFINPFTVVLIVLAVVSLFTDVIFVEPGETPDVTAVVIIVVMVLVSGFLRFIQEMRSNNAAKRLTEMVKTTVYAQRKFHGSELNETHSEKVEIPLDEIVVGDLVYLAAGDMIPADVQTQ